MSASTFTFASSLVRATVTHRPAHASAAGYEGCRHPSAIIIALMTRTSIRPGGSPPHSVTRRSMTSIHGSSRDRSRCR